MKKGLALIALATAACACSHANNIRVDLTGPDITRTVRVGEITEIETSQIDVVYTPGANPGTVTITAPESVMDYIEVYVADGELSCGIRPGVQLNRNNRRMVVTVTAPAVDTYEASLSANIDITGNLTVSELDMETSTSGSITAKDIAVQEDADIEVSTSGSVNIHALTCDKLTLEASTSGSITISGGTARRADYEASTSGSINVSGLRAQSGRIEANTSGSVSSCVVNVTHQEASTGGSLNNRTN